MNTPAQQDARPNRRQRKPDRPVPRRSNPQRMKRLYERYPFLKHYEPPALNPAQWKMLTAGQMVDFFVKYNDDSRGSFYREIYPKLHRYQFGYNPREADEKPSRRLNPVPRWVLFALVEEFKLS